MTDFRTVVVWMAYQPAADSGRDRRPLVPSRHSCRPLPPIERKEPGRDRGLSMHPNGSRPPPVVHSRPGGRRPAETPWHTRRSPPVDRMNGPPPGRPGHEGRCEPDPRPDRAGTPPSPKAPGLGPPDRERSPGAPRRQPGSSEIGATTRQVPVRGVQRRFRGRRLGRGPARPTRTPGHERPAHRDPPGPAGRDGRPGQKPGQRHSGERVRSSPQPIPISREG